MAVTAPRTRAQLTRQLLALLLLPAVLCIVIFGTYSAADRRAEMHEEVDRELADALAMLRTTIIPLAATYPTARLVAISEEIAQRQRVHGVAVYAPDCSPLARSVQLAQESAAVDAIACTVQRTGRGHHAIDEIAGTRVLLRAEPVTGAPHVGVVLVTFDLATVDEKVDRGLARRVMIGFAVCAGLAVLAVVLARPLGRTLGELGHALDRVAGGHFDATVRGTRLLALDRTARDINATIRALAQTHTQLEASEQARRGLERRMRHAQTLAVVGEVSASLAHDIGSPLGTILLAARSAASDERFPPEARAQFDVVANQCERITRIVRRLLSVSRPGEETPEAVDIANVVNEVTAFLAPECRRNAIALSVRCEPDMPAVMASRDQLLQLVMNLCANAVQAQPGGGRLAVAAAPESRPAVGDEDASVRIARPGVLLEVRDAGPGIAETMRHRVFEPFFTTRRSEHGTGLGLSIASGVVRDAGGTITVSTAPEGGACFRVWLPGVRDTVGGALIG